VTKAEKTITFMQGRETAMASKLIIAQLTHDLQAGKSFVTFLWSDNPAKRLGLEVPYGTAIADIEAEARKAITTFVGEMTESEILPLSSSP
jgi:hypothetical protein